MMRGKNAEKHHRSNPMATANCLSAMFFWWVTPFMRTGYSKDSLEIEDLPSCLKEDTSEYLGLRLQSEWEKELSSNRFNKNSFSTNQAKPGKKPSLLRALIRIFKLKLVQYALLLLFQECVLRIVQPIFIGLLLQSLSNGSSEFDCYFYGSGIVLVSVLVIFTYNFYYFYNEHVGMRARIGICSLLYRKCLQLNQTALQQTDVGQLVNLMTNDVSRFEDCARFLAYLLACPIQVLVSFIILYFTLGPSGFIGIVVMILVVPIQTLMGNLFSMLGQKIALRTDERMRTMNEIIAGMRAIKMYAWEKPFAKLVDICRRKEVDVVRRAAFLKAINLSMCLLSSKMITFLTLIVYVLVGNTLTAEKVFILMTLSENLQLVMNSYLPQAIIKISRVLVSVKRIEEFLLLDEVNGEENSSICSTSKSVNNWFIRVDHLTAQWPQPNAEKSTENTLTHLSFTVRPGQLLAVIGQVGAGKSSLLNVILGELEALSDGTCQVASFWVNLKLCQMEPVKWLVKWPTLHKSRGSSPGLSDKTFYVDWNTR